MFWNAIKDDEEWFHPIDDPNTRRFSMTDIFSGGIPAYTEQQQKESEEWLRKLDEAGKKYKTALEISKDRPEKKEKLLKTILEEIGPVPEIRKTLIPVSGLEVELRMLNEE